VIAEAANWRSEGEDEHQEAAGEDPDRLYANRTDVDSASRLVRLERSGIIRPASKSPPPLQAALPHAKASAVDALIDERRSGR